MVPSGRTRRAARARRPRERPAPHPVPQRQASWSTSRFLAHRLLREERRTPPLQRAFRASSHSLPVRGDRPARLWTCDEWTPSAPGDDSGPAPGEETALNCTYSGRGGRIRPTHLSREIPARRTRSASRQAPRGLSQLTTSPRSTPNGVTDLVGGAVWCSRGGESAAHGVRVAGDGDALRETDYLIGGEADGSRDLHQDLLACGVRKDQPDDSALGVSQ